MLKKIKWAPLAESDFSNILKYLDQHLGKNVSTNFIDLTDNLILQISINPKQFPFINKRKGIRKMCPDQTQYSLLPVQEIGC